MLILFLKKLITMKKTKIATIKLSPSLTLLGMAGLLGNACAADSTPAVSHSSDWAKPAWLTDLVVGVKESYDDNVMGVADKMPGMSAHASWISTASPKVGFNFAPLFGPQKTLQTFSLVYAPEFAIFHNAPSESYNAHKIANVIKGQTGDFSFSADNAFLFNDGNSVAPTYALDQSSVAADQADKYRSNFAHGMARERRKQIQDRATVALRYDVNKFFLRPTASLLYYDLMTDLHNTSKAPYKGYQNYIDRADVNGGMDLGYKVTADLALTVGYRYGHQYQAALPYAIDTAMVNGNQMQSSSDYQRLLLGLEGKPWTWLTVKLAGGPDFRDYNSAAPVNDLHPVKFYGEAAITAAITENQSLTFAFKQWQWVASTGKIPSLDSSYGLAYHWNATKQLGFDLGGKIQNADFTSGNVTTGSAGSLRNDILYTISTGVSYAFTTHFNASLSYACDFGRNLQDNLPANLYADYREFDHQVVSLAAQFKF